MSQIIFTRGDAAHHTFAIPASSWSAGGTLFFAAKPAIDDDTSDANSMVNGVWTDSDLLADVTLLINNVPTLCKKYNCYFPPAATNSIPSNGALSADYLGEFQFVPAGGGDPITAPATDDKLDCVVYFDIKRKVVA